MTNSEVVLNEPGGGLPCPRCGVNLVMSERSGIEIDYCPKCRGVWLDRGELDKIIERAAENEAPQPRGPRTSAPPAYDDRGGYGDGYSGGHGGGHHGGGHGGGHHGSRRHGFLGRLFD